MRKIRRGPRRTKPGRLAAYFAKLKGCDPDIVLHNELPARRADAHFLHTVLNAPRYNYRGEAELSVVGESIARGYDITTLNFTIDQAKEV